METLQVITTLIGSLGFPIVACGALFWKINEQDKSHREEIDKLVTTIDGNTTAINRLLDHLNRKEN